MVKRARLRLTFVLATMVTALLLGAWSVPADDEEASVPQIEDWAASMSGPGDNMTGEVTEALARLERAQIARSIGAYEWDSEKRALILHVAKGSAVDIGQIAALLPAVKWEVAADEFPAESLREAANQVAREGNIGDVPVSWAAAKIDGTGLRVALLAQAGSIDEESMREQIASVIGSRFGVEFVYEASGASLIDRQYHTEPYIGGARITTRSGGYLSSCSSGFAIVQDGVPTSKTAMLTADHCGEEGTTRVSGRYVDSPYFGTGQSTATRGADIRMLTGDVKYYGANFAGGPTSNSAVWVKGYSVPLVGQSVCMSGSQSGAVCSNTITDGPVSLNAHDSSGTVHTYTNAYRSVQVFNQPAAGNGDSGGPVLRIVDNKPYATGIISAVQDASDNCAGNPATATRKCSEVVWTAGLDAFFNNNLSWRILTG